MLNRPGLVGGRPAGCRLRLCWAYNLADPWDDQYELNCYDDDHIKPELVEADGIDPVRYWLRDLYDQPYETER